MQPADWDGASSPGVPAGQGSPGRGVPGGHLGAFGGLWDLQPIVEENMGRGRGPSPWGLTGDRCPGKEGVAEPSSSNSSCPT